MINNILKISCSSVHQQQMKQFLKEHLEKHQKKISSTQEQIQQKIGMTHMEKISVVNGDMTCSRTGRLHIVKMSILCKLFFRFITISIKIHMWGFPGGAVVENLPANAGDTGSSPGLGRSHMPRSSQAREPQLLSLRVWSLCSTTREAVIVRGPCTAMKNGPHLPQLEKALSQKRRPNTAKNFKKRKKKRNKF